MLKKNKHGHFGRDAYDIKEQIDALKEEWKSILQAARDEFEAIQSSSLADWESELASTRDQVAELLVEKEGDFASADGFATAEWEAAMASARDDIETLVTELVDTVAAMTLEKQGAV